MFSTDRSHVHKKHLTEEKIIFQLVSLPFNYYHTIIAPFLGYQKCRLILLIVLQNWIPFDGQYLSCRHSLADARRWCQTERAGTEIHKT